MPFLTQGKTNWKYILIVLILAVIVGGGILGWMKKQEVSPTEFSEIKKLEKIKEEKPYIKVISPNGREKLILGDKFDIKWESKEVKKINIICEEKNVESYWYIARGLDPEAGRYSWEVVGPDSPGWEIFLQSYGLPKGARKFAEKLVKIKICDSESLNLCDESDEYFSIVTKERKIFPVANWKSYKSDKFGFEIKYPRDTKLEEKENGIQIDFLFTPGTTMEEKFFSVKREESTFKECFSPLIEWKTKQINDLEFHYIGGEWQAAMGGLVFYRGDYHIMRGNLCYKLSFGIALGSSPPNLSLPSPSDEELDVEIFNQMLSTFRFLE